ncbi:MAG: anti-sigma factor [Bacteroidetes bacterium]|nr:anti-sigma factor [Bacteroidota bacterium]
MELYVHGLATPEEIQEVEGLASEHPEIQQEIDSIRLTLERYVEAHSVPPPDGLKEKLLERLKDVPTGREKNDPDQPASNYPSRNFDWVPKEGSISGLATWLLGLALVAACVAVFLFWQQSQRAGKQAQAAQTQLEQLQKDCDSLRVKDNQVKEQFIAIRHWATKPVQMKGTALSGDAFAVVYWNSVRRTSYLDVVKLPEPAAGKQYQLWAIVEGKPTDMGVFDLSTAADGLQNVPFIENPQAFAVTLEPKGGSQSPTLDQMYVVGAVAKG